MSTITILFLASLCRHQRPSRCSWPTATYSFVPSALKWRPLIKPSIGMFWISWSLRALGLVCQSRTQPSQEPAKKISYNQGSTCSDESVTHLLPPDQYWPPQLRLLSNLPPYCPQFHVPVAPYRGVSSSLRSTGLQHYKRLVIIKYLGLGILYSYPSSPPETKCSSLINLTHSMPSLCPL